ncbi:hypothetical protein KY284_001336 [Solanum tuberosum]|nr:hypothetical protein KY284_001336 [Solanum tuberosum]
MRSLVIMYVFTNAQEHMERKVHFNPHQIGNQVSYEQLLKMINNTTPEQLNQIFNVLNRNTIMDYHRSVNMVGTLVWKVKRTGRVEDGLYVMDWKTKPQQDMVKTMSGIKKGNEVPEVRHKRLGHVPLKRIQE